MIIQKPKIFDEVFKSSTHEIRLYYPHYRNFPTGQYRLLSRSRYLPMPNLLFLRTTRRIHPYGLRQIMAVAVAKTMTPTLEDQIYFFPSHTSFSFVCTDTNHHGLFPVSMSFDEMITIFWSTPFFEARYFPFDVWENLTLEEISQRMVEKNIFYYKTRMTIKNWIQMI